MIFTLVVSVILFPLSCSNASAFPSNKFVTLSSLASINKLNSKTNEKLLSIRNMEHLARSNNQAYGHQQKMPELTMTNLLIAVNIIVYAITRGIPFLSFLHPSLAGNNRLYFRLMKVDDAIRRRGEIYRLVSSLFCHAGGMHLFFNSMSLSSLGPRVSIFSKPLQRFK